MIIAIWDGQPGVVDNFITDAAKLKRRFMSWLRDVRGMFKR